MQFALPSCLCLCSMNLTWRDMQHLVVRTSQPGRLSAVDWRTNGVGRRGRGWLVKMKHRWHRVIFVPVSWVHDGTFGAQKKMTHIYFISY